MSTDTSEAGLEGLIVKAMTGLTGDGRTPAEAIRKAEERCAQNRFSVTRQLRYSRDETQLALDLGLFINGLPVCTFELKNSLTKQTVEDAVEQYKRDRDPRELLFRFGRCVTHFAVDDHEVRFCTHLKGKGSWFLPFNQGWNDGAGNPPNPEGIKTDYLRKRGLTDILEDYAQVVEARNAKTGRKKAAQVFPCYHQLDVVRKLLADAGQQGCRLKALQVFEAREHGEPSKIATPVEGARNWSRLEVAQYCQAAIKAGEPVILGIDHAFSFPMSYMKRYGIETWDRFLDDFIRHWPTADPHTFVDFVREGNPRTGESNELRLCEQWTAGAKSVFQLDMQGSVAKSTHADLPWLLWLREMPGSAERIHFWPFDGFDVPDGKSVVAEIYPSLFRRRYAKAEREGCGEERTASIEKRTKPYMGASRMTEYRRVKVAGATWFFTVNLAERHRNHLLAGNTDALRRVFRKVKNDHPFKINAIVVLPEHLHCIWTLPEGDTDYKTRWSLIKAGFSRGIPTGERRSDSRVKRGERGIIWQRRYWEHMIRDDHDFQRHVDYIHWNPAKHGWVKRVADWPHSSFRAYVRRGVYPLDWAWEREEEINAGE